MSAVLVTASSPSVSMGYSGAVVGGNNTEMTIQVLFL